jgi:hypothetical protein
VLFELKRCELRGRGRRRGRRKGRRRRAIGQELLFVQQLIKSEMILRSLDEERQGMSIVDDSKKGTEVRMAAQFF